MARESAVERVPNGRHRAIMSGTARQNEINYFPRNARRECFRRGCLAMSKAVITHNSNEISAIARIGA
jgi:hypothetical protein